MKHNIFQKLFSNIKVLLFSNIFFIIIIILIIIMNKTPDSSNKILRDQNNSYKLTSPILDCEDTPQDTNLALSYLDLEKKVDSLKSKYGIGTASIYFRDLNNGPWLGINEKEVFSPASLLKIPVVMALFKYAEKDLTILEKEILVTEEDVGADMNQNIVFEGILEKNKKYTLMQVAESSLKKSDNASINIILNNISSSYVGDVFYSIGVPYDGLLHEVDLRVKDYATFFRVLFNASYLNRDMSEKILEILSESEFKDGLVSGVPSDIKVAHKFGERTVGDVYQLHDCGIIYYPNAPYLLCVMTRGNSFKNQETFISDISKYIYTEISK